MYENIKGESLQAKYKLLSYERAFKILKKQYVDHCNRSCHSPVMRIQK